LPVEFKKQLFKLDSKAIRVTINLGFDGEDLKLDGYDIGKTVGDMWGESDYEYSITVESENLNKLYELNKVEIGNKKKLISTLSKFLSINEAYSVFHDYLKDNNIIFKAFAY
jgi:hypothetical protein